MITQEQIDELKEAGVDVSNVKPGTEQYFYIEESDVSKPSKNNSNNSKEFTGDANERRLKLYKDVFAEGEDAAKEFFEVARTLGDGTGGRKLIYKPSTDLFMIENKDGDPTGEGKTFEQAKKLYR